MTNAAPISSKSILILKSHPTGLASTEAFLRNRGWEIYSTADVKSALIQIVSRKHRYILISVDHQNQKVHILPKLIREKFDVIIISFAESTLSRSFNALTAAPTEYKIYAPITGPAVERCINKYNKDQDTLGIVREKHKENSTLPVFLRADDDISSFFISGKEKLNHGFGSVHTIEEKSSARNRRLQELRKLNATNDTLMAQATQRSLIGNVEILDNRVLHKVSKATRPTCIFIDSDRFSGYLIASLGQDENIEERFIKRIQKSLISFLKVNGEHVTETEISRLRIKQVDFEPWALEYADFLKTSAHRYNELAMAFFPAKPLLPQIEISHHHDMIKIQLQDLKGDCPVEFDIYVFLEANNKFVRYTPKGGVFYAKQQERLKGKGVTYLHLQKDSIPALLKYQAQNHLNNLIESYEEKQRFFFPIRGSLTLAAMGVFFPPTA